jgi:hypothetical protein
MKESATPRDDRPWAFGLVVLLLAPPAAAQPIAARSRSEPGTITLSRFVTVTLTLEAPAPLRVEPSEAQLAPESAKGWRIKPLGPPAVETVGERDLWTQRYRLDPFDVPLNAETQVAFAPVKVNGQSRTWPPVRVTVETVWKKPADVKPDDAHPVTGIEELPPRATADPADVGWVILAGAGVVFVAVLVLGVVRRKMAKPPLPPREWALGEFAAAGTLAGRPLADRVADVLRVYVEAQHRLAAPRLTTTELVAEAGAADWPAERVGELQAILERCDRAKFAGAEPDAAEGHDLVARAKAWVAV